MIFYRFLLNTQALGYLFVLEMLLAAHAINHLALLRHAFYHHVDEQLGIPVSYTHLTLPTSDLV